MIETPVQPEKVINVAPKETTMSWQERIGIKELSINTSFAKDRYNTRHHFVVNNPGIYVRFHIPHIQKDQRLKASPVVIIEEYMAGLFPVFGIIPEKVQKNIEEAVTSGLPPGYAAKIDGVIIPRSSKIPVIDALGLGKVLSSPDVSIHIYDQNSDFVSRELLHFTSKRDQDRILKINEKLGGMSDSEREKFFTRCNLLYKIYEKEGVNERLILNPRAPGVLAVKKGLSLIDFYEILLNYANESDWLRKLEQTDYFKDLSPDQREILIKRRQAFSQDKSIEQVSIRPSEIAIIERAINLASKNGEEDDFVGQLRKQLEERNLGLTRYQHNISRGSFFKKTGGEWHQGFLHFFDLLSKILESGELIPREATYSKGTYLQNVDLSLDSPESLKRFVLYAMDPGEKLKNIRAKPIILDIAGRPIPRFKHQENCVRYSPTLLKRDLRRVIVDSKYSRDRVVKLLEENGYKDILVIDISQWQNEMTYLTEAKKQLKEEC